MPQIKTIVIKETSKGAAIINALVAAFPNGVECSDNLHVSLSKIAETGHVKALPEFECDEIQSLVDICLDPELAEVFGVLTQVPVPVVPAPPPPAK